jgi:TIR domain
MAGIFLSYRRIDTEPWAGRLFERLQMRFGSSRVFMDVKGGIPRGANFERVLADALAGCDVLLALIGPDWLTCTRTDGTRRLDAPEDWVRNEIASALQRNVPVVPVLLGGARRPDKSELPDPLHSLPLHETAEIREKDFDYDFEEMVKDVKRQTSLRDVGGLHHPETGTILLRKLIYEMPTAADQMSRSAYAVETARERVKELEFYKTVHDLLHHIEFDIQRPIQEGGPNGGPLRLFRRKFNELHNEILLESEGHDLPGTRTALVEALQSTADTFKDAGDALSQDAYDRLLNELKGVLGFSSFLDGAIAATEEKLGLRHVTKMIAKVRDLIPADGSVQDPDLDRAVSDFSRSVEILHDMHRELEKRVHEHGQFQALDTLLRAICNTPMARLADQWKKVKQARSRLTSPLPQSWQNMSADIESTESSIEAALANGDVHAARGLINDYFYEVSKVFFGVDAELKKFVLKLERINPVLDGLLLTPRMEGPHDQRGRSGHFSPL